MIKGYNEKFIKNQNNIERENFEKRNNEKRNSTKEKLLIVEEKFYFII